MWEGLNISHIIMIVLIMETFIGLKYREEYVDIIQIKNLIKKDINEAIETKVLPHMKLSITTQRFSGGVSLTIIMKSVPFHVFEMRENGSGDLTLEAQKVQKKLEEIANAYRKSEYDVISDYYSTNFFVHVEYFNP
jgi:hypothetical protein